MEKDIKEYVELKGAGPLTEKQKERFEELRSILESERNTLQIRAKHVTLDASEREYLADIEVALGNHSEPRSSTIIAKIKEYGGLKDRLEKGENLTPEDKERFVELESELIPIWKELKGKLEKGENLTPEDEQLKAAFETDYNGKDELRPNEEEWEEEDPKKSCLIPWIIAGICIILAILFGLNWYLVKAKKERLVTDLATVQGNITKAEAERDVAKADAEGARAARNAAEAKLKKSEDALIAPAKAAGEARLKLATIGRGEGIEHAFIRQLISDPSIVEGVKVIVEGEIYDLTFKGDKNNPAALKKWAGETADKIARNQGYVAADGREIWVMVAGIAYLLEKKDGNIVTKEIEKGQDGNFKAIPSDTRETSSSKAQGFEGDTKDGVQRYEKIHTPTHSAQSQASLGTIMDLMSLSQSVSLGAVQK